MIIIIIIIITGLATIVGVKSCSLEASAPYTPLPGSSLISSRGST